MTFRAIRHSEGMRMEAPLMMLPVGLPWARVMFPSKAIRLKADRLPCIAIACPRAATSCSRRKILPIHMGVLMGRYSKA